jgi:hypothetical protein
LDAEHDGGEWGGKVECGDGGEVTENWVLTALFKFEAEITREARARAYSSSLVIGFQRQLAVSGN